MTWRQTLGFLAGASFALTVAYVAFAWLFFKSVPLDDEEDLDATEVEPALPATRSRGHQDGARLSIRRDLHALPAREQRHTNGQAVDPVIGRDQNRRELLVRTRMQERSLRQREALDRVKERG